MECGLTVAPVYSQQKNEDFCPPAVRRWINPLSLEENPDSRWERSVVKTDLALRAWVENLVGYVWISDWKNYDLINGGCVKLLSLWYYAAMQN